MPVVFDIPTPTGRVVFDDEPSGRVVFDESAQESLAPAPRNLKIKAYEEPGIYTRVRESLSPLLGITENQRLRRNQESAQLDAALPQIAAQATAQRPNLMQTEGAMPAMFTPSETQPIQLPQVGVQEGTLAQIGAGLYNPVAGAVNSAIASPGGMLTLPISGPLAVAKPIGRLVAGAFAADQVRQTAEGIPGALDVITNPDATTQQKVEAGAGVALNAALSGVGGFFTRLKDKTPEQASKAIREEIKVTEDKKIADALTDAADRIDREIAVRDAAEAQAKEQQRAIEQQQKLVADAQKAQADAASAAMEIPKSTQILQESATPPPLANIATEAGTQTSPFALQGKLDEITAASAPAVDPAMAQVAPDQGPSTAKANFERRKALFDARKLAEKEAAAQASVELQQISPNPASANPVGEISPRQRAARIRQGNAGVKGASFKAPMAEATVPPFDVAKTPAPAELLSPATDEGFPATYNLTEDIPGHHKGSTVSRATLEKAGFEVPPEPKASNEKTIEPTTTRPVNGSADTAPAAQEVNAAPLLDALSESKLNALADQLGIKTMGMSGERLRARIQINAPAEDIAAAIANPVVRATKAKIKGSRADKWADKIIMEGRATSGFDPELLAAHTIKLVGQLETGAVKFADWSAEKIKEAGEAIQPYLQQIWDSAHAQIAAKPGDRVFDGTERGTSKSSLGKYEYIKTSNDAQVKAAQPILDYVTQTGDFDGGFAKLREIQNTADRSIAAASMIPEAEKIADPMLRDRVVARLFREAKDSGTDAAQALQAQGKVNEIIAPYRGHLAWMDILQSRLRDEVAPLFPENSAEIINKGLKDAGNKAAEEIANDTPGVNSVLKGAISRVKKSVGIDWRKVFIDLPEKQAERKAEIFKRINEDPKVASLSEAAKKKLSETMEEAWENLKNKEFRKEFEKTIELPSIKKTEREALKKAYPDLVEKANLGLLDNEAFVEAMGRQYGIEGLDSATGKKLRDLGQKAARTPEGSERNEVFQEIMDTIMQARGVNPWDFLKDYWYRNVMSAPRTAVEIGAGGVIQGAARTFTTAVDTALRHKDPGLALRMIGMFMKDAATGARLGADLVVTGDRAILPRYTEQFLAKMKNLEEGKSPGGEIESLYRRSSGVRKAALAPFEYTGRLLTALDYIGGQGVRSQQMLYSALTRGDKVSFDAAMRRFNVEEVAKANQQARTELGPKARPAQIIARQRELLNQGIDKEIQDFGNTMTEVTALNAPPAGISGEVYKAVAKMPMIVRAPAGLAFAKAGLNIFQELTNWAPITGQVNWARTLWRNPSKNNPLRFLALDKLPPERARQLVVAQATGLAVLTAAASKFLGSQPEDDQNKPREWEISGPWTGLTPTQKSALMSAGERPLSIKLPGGRWVDYKLTPFMSSLATIGHIRDQERFNGKKYTDEQAANKTINAWLMGLGSVKDLSLASTFSRLAGFLATDDRDLSVGGVTRTLADSVGNSAVGFVPMSSMLRELDNATDSQRYRSGRKNPGIDLWLSQVPFVRRFVNDGKPLLNFLGEPVNIDVNPLNRHVGPSPSTAPVEAALSGKVAVGMKLPTLSDNTTIVDKDGKQRPMTGEEVYDYQKSVRQAYARQIAHDLPLFQKATPEQASLYSQQVFTAAERYARDRLNTGSTWDGVVPVNTGLTSAISPEYQAAKAADSAEGSQSALNASKMRVQYDQLMALPAEERAAALRQYATTQPQEQTRALIQHATSRATNRTALERATSGLSAPTRAELFTAELAKRATAEEKRAYLQQQLAAGLINKEILRQMAMQGQQN